MRQTRQRHQIQASITAGEGLLGKPEVEWLLARLKQTQVSVFLL